MTEASEPTCYGCEHFCVTCDLSPREPAGACLLGLKEWWRAPQVLDWIYDHQRAGSDPACEAYEEER